MTNDSLPDQSGAAPDDGSRRSFMKQAGGILGLALAPPFISQAERLTAMSRKVQGVIGDAAEGKRHRAHHAAPSPA